MKGLIDLSDDNRRRELSMRVCGARGLHRVELTKIRDPRSIPQNKYYWGVHIPHVQAGIEEAWGETLDEDEVHQFLRQRFLSRPVVNHETGQVMETITRSTAALDVEEFTIYLDQIAKFAAEWLGVEIPLPRQEATA